MAASVSLSLFLPLWALCCLLFSLMCSPERGLHNNNSRHNKREDMQPYRPYTLQRITQLPSTHCLTGWRNRGSGPWLAWEESVGCVCRKSGWEKNKWGRRWRNRRVSVDSNCYCCIMMQSPAPRHLKQLPGPTAIRLTGWSGSVTPAQLWKTRHRRGGGTVTLTYALWFKLLTSAILCLQHNGFPTQTMTDCVQHRPNNWTVCLHGDSPAQLDSLD